MLVHVLGPLRVTGIDDHGAPTPTPTARKHRELLALLALEPGRTLGVDALADGLWRGTPPPSAATTLQGYVRRVRAGLGASVVVSDAFGYRLAAEVDAVVAAREIGEAQALLAAGDAAAAVPLLTGALGRWRGPAFAEVADLEVARPVVARFDELRWEAEHALARARLALGRDHEAVSRLRALIAEHPMREGFVELLARALHRVGRRAEGLESLRVLRTTLREELGVDPSAAIARLETELLRADEPDAPGAALLHGRSAELTALRRAWSRTREGVCVVVVTGEPGIGKTALVEALAAEVHGAGAPVVRARATSTDDAVDRPPFWLWRPVTGSDPAGPGDHRWAVGLRIARALQGRATGGPLLVVLDDLHWADPDSLAVLETILDTLRSDPVLVAVTCRDGVRRPAVTAALAALARRPGTRLALDGLPAEAVAALAVERGVPRGATGPVVARAGGNPFLAGELADLAATGVDAGQVLPRAVLDVVRARVESLSATARSVLATAAVAGDGLGLTALAAAAGDVADDEMDTALDALAEEGLLVTGPSVRLRHDLVREAVRDLLPPARRAAVHRRVADAIARLDPEATAAVAAHRCAAAGPGVDADATDACLLAAREALDRGGDEDAVAWGRKGLTHAGPGAREDLYRVVSEALLRAGRIEEAEATLAAEAASVRARGDHARLADIALAATPSAGGGYWTGSSGHLVGSGALLAEALAHADDLDAARRGGLAAAESVRRSAVGEPGAGALADEARHRAALVDGPAGPRCRARATIARFVADWGPETITTRLAGAEELVRLTAGTPDLESTAVHLLRTAQLEAGRLDASRRTSRRFAALAAARPDPDAQLAQAEWDSMLDLLRGEHDAARARVEDAAAGLDRLAPAAAAVLRMTVTTIAGIIAWNEGRLVEMVGATEAIAADADADYRLASALGLAQGGRGEAAVELAAQLLADPASWEGPRATIRTVMLAETLVTTVETSRSAAPAAREHLSRLVDPVERWQDGMVVLWPGAVCLGPTTLYRGAVRAALGRPGAADDLRRAATLAESVGARPSLDRARRRLASCP